MIMVSISMIMAMAVSYDTAKDRRLPRTTTLDQTSANACTLQYLAVPHGYSLTTIQHACEIARHAEHFGSELSPRVTLIHQSHAF
jgi:hypothetical protein